MKKVIYSLLAFAPVVAFAQTQNFSNVNGIVIEIKTLLGYAIPILFALALIYFFIGVIKYISAAGDPKAAASGKSIMIYGIIGLAVMASVWGLVAWLQNVFGVGGQQTVTPPTVTGIPIQ